MSNSPATPSPAAIGKTDWCLAAVGTAVSVLFIGVLLERCRYGFDFTDEGFYLNWIATPWSFVSSLTEFGFVYHPLYRLAGNNLVVLRQAGLLITLALTWTLCLALVRQWTSSSATSNRHDYLIATVLSTSSLGSLLYSYWWLPAPSYNTLAFQALVVGALAVLTVARDLRSGAMGGLVLGVAVWLAVAAKPTTAAALCLLSVASLVLAGHLTWRVVATALASATIAMGALAVAIDGSPHRFAGRLLAASHDGSLLSRDHSLAAVLRLDSYSFSPAQRELFVIIFLAAFLATVVAIRKGTVARAAWGVFGLSISALSVVICSSAWFGPPAWLATELRPLMFQGLQLTAAAFGTIAGLATTARWKGGDRSARSSLAVCLFLVACPYAYVLGTLSNYWVPASNVSAFWLLAAVPLAGLLNRERTRAATLSMALIAQCMTIGLVVVGLENPYRQAQALRLNTDKVRMATQGEELTLSPSSARYLRTLRAVALQHGFAARTPVIDLTGHYPGALYALGATPLGHAWMLGGYPGSQAFATAGLDRVPCAQIARAWILEEPGGPRAISAELLRRYGIEPVEDMQVVAELASPTEDFPTSAVQRLLKPRRPIGSAGVACEAERSRRSPTSARAR